MENYCINDFFAEASETIRFHFSSETVIDPYEKNTEVTNIGSLPIKAIVSDISPASAIWKMPGIATDKTKQIIFKKKYETTLKASQKIEINKEFYYGWKINSRLSYRIEGDFIRAYVYIKKES